MKVIILCGGTGTRLKEETEYKPKPMVYIGNKPLILHIMKIYSHYGINDFILALGYKADYIKDFFLNQKAFTSDFTLDLKTHSAKYYRKNADDFRITFVDTGVEATTGARILACQKYLDPKDTHFMVTYGDGVSNINIPDLLKFHKKQKTLGTITGVHPRSKYGLAKYDANNLITHFEEKPVLDDWVNGGYMVFDAKALDYFKEEEMDTVALNKMAQNRELSLYFHDDFWFAIDTYKELEDLNTIWNSGKAPWKIWK